MPGGPGVPNRNVNFGQGSHDHEDPPFDLPPDKEAYYKGTSAGEKLREEMKGMSVKERHEHMRGLRETLNDSVPKPGDFDTPLKRDLPPVANQGPRPPRARRVVDPLTAQRAQTKRMKNMARMARGKGRRR